MTTTQTKAGNLVDRKRKFSSIMLRFFSRRKAKGRAEQKIGVGGKKAVGKHNKHVLSCNIILLDGSDLALEIGVSCRDFAFCFFLLSINLAMDIFWLSN